MVADPLKCLTTDCTADQSCFDSEQGQNIFVPKMSRLALEIRPKDTVSSRRREADTLPSNAEVQNERSHSFTPPCVFVARTG